MYEQTICPPVRRRIWAKPHLGLRDLRGEPPRGWCCLCGSEVYEFGQELCFRCEKEDQHNDRKQIGKPLRGLYPGT